MIRRLRDWWKNRRLRATNNALMAAGLPPISGDLDDPQTWERYYAKGANDGE